MLSEKDIELWYLGFPFKKESGNGNGDGKKPADLVKFPSVVNDEEAERFYLGLPFKVA